MSEFGSQNPGRIFCVDSEFEVRNEGFWQPEAEIYENLPQKFRKLCFLCVLCFMLFLMFFFAAERLAQKQPIACLTLCRRIL